MASLCLEEITAWLAHTLMSTRIKHSILLCRHANSALIITQVFWNIKHFKNQLLSYQIDFFLFLLSLFVLFSDFDILFSNEFPLLELDSYLLISLFSHLICSTVVLSSLQLLPPFFLFFISLFSLLLLLFNHYCKDTWIDTHKEKSKERQGGHDHDNCLSHLGAAAFKACVAFD